jgi:hypothetical protein
MKELILITIPLVISGLGFLSYKHPKIARKILTPMMYSVAAIFCLISIYNLVQTVAYYDAIDVVRSHVDYAETYGNEPTPFNSSNLDSALIQKYNRELFQEIKKAKITMVYSIQDKITDTMEKHEKTKNTNLLYCVFAFIVINTLIGLSLLFEYMQDKNDVKNDNETK